eukprot:2999236-Ditylum_brightwellii.AAC.1
MPSSIADRWGDPIVLSLVTYWWRIFMRIVPELSNYCPVLIGQPWANPSLWWILVKGIKDRDMK